MSRPHILPINDATDGDGRTPDRSRYSQDDSYFLGKLGQGWAKEQGLTQTGATFSIDRLPAGYSGWKRQRDGSTHVDYYLWGHPQGVLRSLPEALPHFLWLMDGGAANPVPCSCSKCNAKKTPNKRARPVNNGISDSNSISSGAVKNSTRSTEPLASHKSAAQPQQPLRQHGQFSSSDDAPAVRRKQVDEDGVVDIYRALLDKLKDAGPEKPIDVPFSEPSSPDAYVGAEKLEELIAKWQHQPAFIPRLGEVVLFVRRLSTNDSIRWSPSAKKFRVYDNASAVWAEQTVWEAGVITQEPTEICTNKDLVGTSDDKKTSINQWGFRVQSISSPQKHVYVPLHAIRPLALWQQCAVERNTHQTVKEAITTAKSFCVLRKFHFKGTWPNATIFAKALYIGPELIMVGDLVRFLNDFGEVDVLKITSIKLVFLNVHEASNDDWDDRRPYSTVLHVSGHAYSLEPTRSFDVMGKVPASTNLPSDLPQGDWFHVTDPANPKMRVEIPYSRVISRYPGDAAISAWFDSPPTPATSFQPVNSVVKSTDDTKTRISHGVVGTLEARKYSELHSQQIARSEGKTWFWADTRIEQLNLKEVNDRDVGQDMKTIIRIPGKSDPEVLTRAEMMPSWRSALQGLSSKSGSMEHFRKPQIGEMGPPSSTLDQKAPQASRVVTDAHRTREPTENESGSERTPVASQYEELSSSSVGSKRSRNAMEVDHDETADTARKIQHTLQRRIETIEIDDSD